MLRQQQITCHTKRLLTGVSVSSVNKDQLTTGVPSAPASSYATFPPSSVDSPHEHHRNHLDGSHETATIMGGFVNDRVAEGESVGSDLLNHVIAEMKRDQRALHAKEAELYSNSASPVNNNRTQQRSRTTSPRDPKAERPPALCATHPANYKQALSTPAKSMPAPPTPAMRHGALAKPHTLYGESILPWEVYTDPKRLTSGVPAFPDPMFKRLKMDINPDEPKVLSPLFMIGLPCGDMIEGANFYETSSPRDAPNA